MIHIAITIKNENYEDPPTPLSQQDSKCLQFEPEIEPKVEKIDDISHDATNPDELKDSLNVSNGSNEEKMENNMKKIHKCDSCGKSFSSTKYLKTHNQKIHGKNEPIDTHQQTEQVNKNGGVFVSGQPLRHELRIRIVELAKNGTDHT